jgi:hypothetical protein
MALTYLSDCLPTTIGETVTYNLRNNDDYRTQKSIYSIEMGTMLLK